jgi:hypothetical protein
VLHILVTFDRKMLFGAENSSVIRQKFLFGFLLTFNIHVCIQNSEKGTSSYFLQLFAKLSD